MKVAIVCDWLLGIGGAERVVLEIHKLYPDAPIYTSQFEPAAADLFKDAQVKTTWLQHLPTAFRKFLPVLRAVAFSRLNLDGYDLVISASGAEAKGVKTNLDTIHISYIHAPTHYYWLRYNEYLAQPGFGKLDWLARFGLRLLIWPMRRWDKQASNRPNYLIANSNFTRSEIQKYYGRDSVVIHPPVDLARFKFVPTEASRSGFVVAGRQTPYKRIDLAVVACTKLKLPLIVIGDGAEHDKLVAMAGPSVSFISDVSDQEMPGYFRSAKALIFPTNTEDFGVTAVEALAVGTPVIAFRAGGPLDYIKDGDNGLFFDKLNVESLAETLQKFIKLKFDNQKVASSAQVFSDEHFKTKLKTFIEDKL